jgi:hypothetical protein
MRVLVKLPSQICCGEREAVISNVNLEHVYETRSWVCFFVGDATPTLAQLRGWDLHA